MPAATRIWTGQEGSSRRTQREPRPADTWISAQWYRLWTSGFQNCCLTSLCWFVTAATRNEYTLEQTTPKHRGRTRQSVFLAGGLRAGRGSAHRARLHGGGSAPSHTLLLGPAGGGSTVGQREPPSAWTQNWNIVTSTRVPWPSHTHEPAQRGDPGEGEATGGAQTQFIPQVCTPGPGRPLPGVPLSLGADVGTVWEPLAGGREPGSKCISPVPLTLAFTGFQGLVLPLCDSS